nr:putative capsid protein [Lake Sarah-associated circular virus-29]
MCTHARTWMPCRKMARRRVTRKMKKPRASARRNATQEFLMKPAIKARGSRSKRQGYMSAAMGTGLMPCTKRYMDSILDPSGDAGRGACVPSGFPIPSQKARAFLRGTMSTGTGGNGYILFTPSLGNDNAIVRFTTAANTAVGTEALNNAVYTASNSSISAGKLPYSTAQIASGNIDARIVSAMIRVRFAGAEDNRSGIVTLLEDPDHNSLFTQTPAQVASFEGATRERPNGDGAWSQICWSGPCKQTEVEYVNTATQTTQTDIMAILINGTTNSAGAPGPQPFEYEAWINCEYIGRDAIGKTDNQNDQMGMDAVTSIFKKFAGTPQVQVNPESAPSIRQAIRTHQMSVSGSALPRPKTLAGDLIEGAVTAFNPGWGRLWGSLRDRIRARK